MFSFWEVVVIFLGKRTVIGKTSQTYRFPKDLGRFPKMSAAKVPLQ